MPTASLEAMLELWSTSLREAKDQLRPLFAAPSVARSASAFLEGLLGAERRKTGWMAFAVLARVRQRANGLPPKTERRAKLARALVAAGDPAGREPTRATAH